MTDSRNLDWVMCNKCLHKYGNISFHLTQCGHIYCNKCITSAEKKCFQCNAVDTISLPIDEPLSPQIAHYFDDASETVQKVSETLSFQQSQRNIIYKMCSGLESKYQQVKQAYWTSAENLKKVMEKNNQLKLAYKAMLHKEKNINLPQPVITPDYNRYGESIKQRNYFQESQSRSSQRFIEQPTPSTVKRGDGIFKVPSSRTPGSAGYYTASSRGSNASSSMMREYR